MFGLFNRKKRAKILLVDDDFSITQTLRERLEMCDYAVITACNGQQGLKKALAYKPDIVLLDNDMPVMDGREMLERLRENPSGRDICVIMVTAAGLIQDIDHADKCGVDDYILKPFKTHDLVLKIEAILENRGMGVKV
jgi:two-component system, OmpR family, response regulator